ncbi:hypothetical protein [Methanobrevibacter sp. DSM 116169]|uniref:hypothetical protein n=1 Tax=Methanobrevibacter sp. DSM 116169 TaxID=3242727 RepID=UPI0038FC077C
MYELDLSLKDLNKVLKYVSFKTKNYYELYELRKHIGDCFFEAIGLTDEEVELKEYEILDAWSILPTKKYVGLKFTNNLQITIDQLELLKLYGFNCLYYDEGLVFMFRVKIEEGIF